MENTIKTIASKLTAQLKGDNNTALVGARVNNNTMYFELESAQGYFELTTSKRCIRFNSLSDLEGCIEKCI